METLPGGLQLTISQGAFPLSTDSMVLADFVKLPRNAKVLDLGSGCGTLGLMLLGRDPTCCVTGIEVTEAAHRGALQNILDNHLEGRMESLCRDLRQVPSFLTPGSFSVCVSNPPYFSGGPESSSLPDARKQKLCTPKDLFAAATWALKYGGDFYLVQKPEALGSLILEAGKQGLEAKRLTLLRHRENGPIVLILLSFRKGGKPGLQLKELSLQDSHGNPTEDYNRIYHTEER